MPSVVSLKACVNFKAQTSGRSVRIQSSCTALHPHPWHQSWPCGRFCRFLPAFLHEATENRTLLPAFRTEQSTTVGWRSKRAAPHKVSHNSWTNGSTLLVKMWCEATDIFWSELKVLLSQLSNIVAAVCGSHKFCYNMKWYEACKSSTKVTPNVSAWRPFITANRPKLHSPMPKSWWNVNFNKIWTVRTTATFFDDRTNSWVSKLGDLKQAGRAHVCCLSGVSRCGFWRHKDGQTPFQLVKGSRAPCKRA